MSEKGSLSYWLGMILAKLSAESELQVPWLAHVDPLVRSGVVRLSLGSRSRGDLLGKDVRGDWHVVEAKGRSNAPESGLVAAMKRQAGRVRSINGIEPATASAMVARLDTAPISVYVEDPSVGEDDPDTEEWVVEEGAFWKSYYGEVVEFLRQASGAEETVRGLAYRVAGFGLNFGRGGERTLRIGLLQSIFERPGMAPQAVQAIKEVTRGSEEISIGPDGILLGGNATLFQ